MREHVTVISGRGIGQLARPFEGGSGPGHTAIVRIWTIEDALEYLPDEGSKADRVLYGLKALRDGKGELPPAPRKLAGVVSSLVDALTDYGVSEDDLSEALEGNEVEAQVEVPNRSAPASPSVSAPHPQPDPIDPDGPIFVVHGHDQALLHEAVRVLERGTRREVIVLHEQPNAGQTVLEKFESHAAAASYAVVLLTADDVGAVTGGEPVPRGRQNVIFELGFFFGKLGRKRVAVLLGAGVEQPSDIAGLVYIAVDTAGAWKYKLAKELAAADIPVDRDRIP